MSGEVERAVLWKAVSAADRGAVGHRGNEVVSATAVPRWLVLHSGSCFGSRGRAGGPVQKGVRNSKRGMTPETAYGCTGGAKL